MLHVENESTTDAYEHFIQANKEVAKEIIPQRKRAKRKRASEDARVQKARRDVQHMFSKYRNDQSTTNQENLQKSKIKLQEAYDAITEEELSEMIQKVEVANGSSNHGQSWSLINMIAGRKTARKGILKGNSKDDRLKKWHQYFSELLGSEPTLEGDPSEDIPTVLQNLNIESGSFSKDEYTKVKEKLSLGKAAGPDGIPRKYSSCVILMTLFFPLQMGCFKEKKQISGQ